MLQAHTRFGSLHGKGAMQFGRNPDSKLAAVVLLGQGGRDRLTRNLHFGYDRGV